MIMDAVSKVYQDKVDEGLTIRRFNVCAEGILPRDLVEEMQRSAPKKPIQLSIYSNLELEEELNRQQEQELNNELVLQQVMIDIKNKFGKNAILRGMNLKSGATMKERNAQIGGHKA